jgi:hypothetical protein
MCECMYKRKPDNWDHEGMIFYDCLEQRQAVASGRYSDVLRNQLKPAVRRQRRGLSSSGVFSAACQCPTSYNPSYRETDSRFPTAGVTPPATFTRLGTQRFSPLLVLKDALLGRNLRSKTCSLHLQGGIDIVILKRRRMCET